MHALQFIGILLGTYYFSACNAIPTRITFEKCSYKGFTCPVSQIFAPRIDIVFECNNITTQDVQFYLWQFNAPSNIASLTIQKCDRVQIAFTCTGENKPIQWLKITDIGILEIIPAPVNHNPPEIYFENISYIEKIPTYTFSQIKYESYKAGCFVPINDTNTIYFKDINIGNIETDAFKNLQYLKKFSWSNVSINRIDMRAVNISFENGGCGELKRCNLGVVEPMAFQISGDSFSITNGRIGDIWANGFNGTIYDFQFTNNSIDNIQSGAISVLSQYVYILNNRFNRVESGAFKKISPGLLHDSRRSFRYLKFIYHFNNNVFERVDSASFRPDIRSYQNVNANLCYSYNTLPCSCEGLTWLGTDVDLGSTYSEVKIFNTMLLDPENSNMCSFTPCMCFGGTAKQKKVPSTNTQRLITFLD